MKNLKMRCFFSKSRNLQAMVELYIPYNDTFFCALLHVLIKYPLTKRRENKGIIDCF